MGKTAPAARLRRKIEGHPSRRLQNAAVYDKIKSITEEIGEVVAMLSDIEIAHKCKMKDIGEIAAELGLKEKDIERYGRYKAKITTLPHGKKTRMPPYPAATKFDAPRNPYSTKPESFAFKRLKLLH